MRLERRRRGEYGFDAPRQLAPIGGIGLLFGALAVLQRRRRWLALGEAAVGLPFLLTFGLYLHATRRGKFLVWADLLDELELRGDDRVLDMGCGRGAVLTMAAKLVPRGLAVGLDLWTADQSGNRPETARHNLLAEGVAGHCQLETGDMTALPFATGSFDLVVSSLAIHNIAHFQASKEGCLRAVDEAARVLKPGGRLLIADLGLTPLYAKRLREVGMAQVAEHRLGWRFWYGPWMGANLVAASKPSA